MHGAMRRMSIRTLQASLIGNGTSNALSNSIALAPLRAPRPADAERIKNPFRCGKRRRFLIRDARKARASHRLAGERAGRDAVHDLRRRQFIEMPASTMTRAFFDKIETVCFSPPLRRGDR